MKLIATYAPNVEIASVDLNTWQTVTDGTRNANDASNYLAAMTGGVDARTYMNNGSFANATILTVDDSSDIDWMDRIVIGRFWDNPTANSQPGGAGDYDFGNTTGATFQGYTGRGALDGGGHPPSAGNRPVPASGTSWAAKIWFGGNLVWLYVDPSDLKLKLYNQTGGAIALPFLWVQASGQTGKRP